MTDGEDDYLHIAFIKPEPKALTRVVRLPKHVKMEEIKCELDEQGKLSVNVPKVAAIEEKKSTNIPIQTKKQDAVEGGKAK
ncbi:unnamed protein product [Bursaphelenchus xylophilus]|uniref:(pine wood nematode) hypothetical protein n=1 Tax=Bursaphelenchus xylophilus TaxID=6326 RepID=A0A1I7RYS2_BURXY|nr:unnamed protein product [Bursaphelenchus xylophilus]CAG9092315.1 unnamed protein product [Bursaphelenchus xylophilus]